MQFSGSEFTEAAQRTAVGKTPIAGSLTGEEGAYFAGPVAQAKDGDTGRKNAASDEGQWIGPEAYWIRILHTLHIYKGSHEVEVTVDSQFDLKVARAAADKAVSKLP
jgi:hypothetical protein